MCMPHPGPRRVGPATGLPSARSVRMVMATLLLSGAALAQPSAPAGTSLATQAVQRFPQPVRVGDLINRTVLRPVESQVVLGHVARVVRSGDGTVLVVVALGGLFGLGARPVAVPVDSIVLLGAEVEVVGFTPAQLRGLPTFDAAGSVPVAPDDTIRVGLARPSH